MNREDQTRFDAIYEEMAALRERMKELEAELSVLAQEEKTCAETERENQAPAKPVLPEITEFAAGVIGKTVIEAAKYCNRLSADASDPQAKELVNLILGRTEVVKAEILQVLSSAGSDEDKKQAILAKQAESLDYFTSVMAQK